MLSLKIGIVGSRIFPHDDLVLVDMLVDGLSSDTTVVSGGYSSELESVWKSGRTNQKQGDRRKIRYGSSFLGWEESWDATYHQADRAGW